MFSLQLAKNVSFGPGGEHVPDPVHDRRGLHRVPEHEAHLRRPRVLRLHPHRGVSLFCFNPFVPDAHYHSWTLSVFLKFFTNNKLFFAFFIKLI